MLLQKMTETRRYTVCGVVQGVWFRRHTADVASEIGVNGWVRNTADGNVELVATGEPQQLQQLQSALWKGSPMSDVTAVDDELVEDYTGQGFEIRWDDLPPD